IVSYLRAILLVIQTRGLSRAKEQGSVLKKVNDNARFLAIFLKNVRNLALFKTLITKLELY
ncbi:hypothetical protein, partial [Vibrio sp. V34_P3A8T189]|uniref:hypothetical protein n=1 Tax=Vibrio sp. V34_P3A8T189 TaxID=1938686 RepID=UPI001F3BF881